MSTDNEKPFTAEGIEQLRSAVENGGDYQAIPKSLYLGLLAAARRDARGCPNCGHDHVGAEVCTSCNCDDASPSPELPVAGWYKSVRELLGVDRGEPQSLERKLLLQLAKEIVVLRTGEAGRVETPHALHVLEKKEPFEEEGRAAYEALTASPIKPEGATWENCFFQRSFRAAAQAAIKTHQKKALSDEAIHTALRGLVTRGVQGLTIELVRGFLVSLATAGNIWPDVSEELIKEVSLNKSLESLLNAFRNRSPSTTAADVVRGAYLTLRYTSKETSK